MQEQRRPDINIVCEKIAFQGLTRFENRECLPLGVSTNFTAYSAKLLTQVGGMASYCLLRSQLGSWHGRELLTQVVGLVSGCLF